MLEVSSSKPLASESKGFAFWVELVAPGLPSAENNVNLEVTKSYPNSVSTLNKTQGMLKLIRRPDVQSLKDFDGARTSTRRRVTDRREM
ncbi:hypothetical protein H5410_055475 [Solanum commersonii]|uniref:Uncharacterized protein n=1 Tax=Solanum commersonii TaxID=4109 RepID=A0A9J5WIU8_SOLCO|nr:hypothetical protein H5410_055475 [Solanum commersonii]